MPTRLQVNVPALHPAQQAVYAHPARFRVLACGRRWGKTRLATRLLVERAVKGQPVAYFAPTYKLMGEVWRELKRTLAPVTVSVSEQDKRIETVTGGILDCWSLDNDTAGRSRKYALVVVDEAAYVRDGEAFAARIRPTLTDLRGGALLLSTPNGMNWFYDAFGRGQDPLQPDWASFHYPTVSNPYIAPDEVESARLLLPERLFTQEYLAAFHPDGSGVFRGVRAVSGLPPVAPYAGRFAFGVDWGRSHDYTVVSVLDMDTRQQVALDRFTDTAWVVQRAQLATLAADWRPQVIVAETNSMGSPNVEALQAEGLPVVGFETTAASKSPLIESLALAIERAEVGLLADDVQRGELEAYALERLPSGRYRYSAPDGKHDDTVMALALAWHGVLQYGAAGVRTLPDGLADWRG